MFLKIICPTITLALTLLAVYAYDIESQYYSLGASVREKVRNILHRPFLLINWLGVISFVFYCCHCQIIYKVAGSLHTWPAALGISMAFTLIWAIILHIWVEKPTAKIGTTIKGKNK